MKNFGLTARELQVIALVAQGYTNTGIASLLFIAESTVGDHKKAILRKLNATNSPHAVAVWMSSEVAA